MLKNKTRNKKPELVDITDMSANELIDLIDRTERIVQKHGRRYAVMKR